MGGALGNLGTGLGGSGVPFLFAPQCPARIGHVRFRRTQPGCAGLLRGSRTRRFARRRSASSGQGGSGAPGSLPDGFRNRVAAVSALGQPHPCRPALGSPTALRSEPGNPTLAGPEQADPNQRQPGASMPERSRVPRLRKT